VHGQPASKVRKSERRLPVPPVRRADQGEEGLVLCDREELAVAQGPPQRGEIPSEHANLTHERICQTVPSFSVAWTAPTGPRRVAPRRSVSSSLLVRGDRGSRVRRA